MQKRVFICTEHPFPRGSAGANYIQYLALALKAAGFSVRILSTNGRKAWCEEENEHLFYKDLELIIPDRESNRILRKVENRFFRYRPFCKVLDSFHPGPGDALLVYSSNYNLVVGLRNYAQKRSMKSIITPVEYFMASSFPGGEKGIAFRRYCRLVEKEIPQFDIILPISNYLAQVYRNFGKDSRVLPIMADVSEFNEDFRKDFSGKRKIVFPASGVMKDDVEGMLFSLAELDESLLKNTELHITQFNNGRERVQAAFDSIEDPGRRQLLQNAVVYHNRLEYMDLVELYRDMHFLLLIREKNQQMLAGFPSKLPETMAFGIIPIATAMGDYAEYYLQDGIDSLLIYESGTDACKEAISRGLMLSPEEIQRMSFAAHTTAKDRFDYHNWVDFLKTELAET